MLYFRQVPNLTQTNLNEIYASQTASIERGGHPDMEFLQSASLLPPSFKPSELFSICRGRAKAFFGHIEH